MVQDLKYCTTTCFHKIVVNAGSAVFNLMTKGNIGEK